MQCAFDFAVVLQCILMNITVMNSNPRDRDDDDNNEMRCRSDHGGEDTELFSTGSTCFPCLSDEFLYPFAGDFQRSRRKIGVWLCAGTVASCLKWATI